MKTFMSQPERHIKPGEESKTCKVNKANGLKQAARNRNIKTGDLLKKFSFVKSTVDLCLFKRPKEENTLYNCLSRRLVNYQKDRDINNTTEVIKRKNEVKYLG